MTCVIAELPAVPMRHELVHLAAQPLRALEPTAAARAAQYKDE